MLVIGLIFPKGQFQSCMSPVALGKRHWTLIPYVSRSVGGKEGNRLAMNNLKTLSCQNFPNRRIPDSHSYVHSWLPSSEPVPLSTQTQAGRWSVTTAHVRHGSWKMPQIAAKETQSPSRHYLGPDANSDFCVLPSSFPQRSELLEKCWCFTRERDGRILCCVSLKQRTTPCSHSL